MSSDEDELSEAAETVSEPQIEQQDESASQA